MNNIKIQQHKDDNQQTPFDNEFKYQWDKFANRKLQPGRLYRKTKSIYLLSTRNTTLKIGTMLERKDGQRYSNQVAPGSKMHFSPNI